MSRVSAVGVESVRWLRHIDECQLLLSYAAPADHDITADHDPLGTASRRHAKHILHSSEQAIAGYPTGWHVACQQVPSWVDQIGNGYCVSQCGEQSQYDLGLW